MKVQSRILVRATAGDTTVAGGADGEAWATKIRPTLERVRAGLLAVDFAEIELATASWLREAVLGVERYCRALRPDVVVIIANACAVILEELTVVLNAQNAVIIAARVLDAGDVADARVIGRLEAALDESLRVALRATECDASALVKAIPGLGLSAANNRLAALQARHVLRSERRGRSRIYRPLVAGLSYGH